MLRPFHDSHGVLAVFARLPALYVFPLHRVPDCSFDHALQEDSTCINVDLSEIKFAKQYIHLMSKPCSVAADVTTLANTDLQKVKRNGDEYLEVKNLKWEIDMKDTRIQYNNLFNGDKTLGKYIT